MTTLRKIRQQYGLQPKAITNGLQLPEIATREQLDAIRDQGVLEMQRDGHSQAYLVWQEALRRGLDQSLPSLRDMTGLASDHDAVVQETIQAVKSSQQLFDPMRIDERVAGLEVDDIPIEQWDAHDLLDRLHGLMAETPDSDRGELMEIIAGVQNSPFGSMGASIEVNMPDPVQTYEVASEEESTGDWYTDQMNAAQQQQQRPGLEGLMIGGGYDANGFKGLGGGGGTYSVGHDVNYQMALARGDFDDAGDDGDDDE